MERLVGSLSALLTVRRRPIPRQRTTFLDTADGRIRRAGACLTLTTDAGGNRLQWRQGNVSVGCTLGGELRFAWDLPPGGVRQRIEPVVEMRRLLPLAVAEQDGVQLDVMDEARKTVARLSIVVGRARAPQRRSSWRQFQPFLTLKALRGYDDQCAGPMAIIESRPGIERSALELQGHVLSALGADQPRDVSMYRVDLDPAVRADIGTLCMQRELWRVVAANHAGVVSGLDSEFLHDFRVGVRRSRTLLAQINGVLPQAEVDRFKAEFSWLARITGSARDLDVLLLGLLRSPSKSLDEDRRGAILARLEQERAGVQDALAEQLTGERYLQLAEGWRSFLDQDPRHVAGDGCGALPLATIVSQRVWWLYRRTLSSIEHVSGDTPAQELHQIRINARDLRYLIDAAAGLYDAGDLGIVLRALARLESVLGEYNDACVQSGWLRQYAAKLDEATRDGVSLRSAAEALADAADRRAAALRKPANQQLLRFGESATRAAFERVFHIKHLTEFVQ